MSTKTTEGKPDPSNRPFPGLMSSIADDLSGSTIVLTLNRSRCSLDGIPQCWRVDDGGSLLSSCTAATLDGDLLTLTFDNADAGCVGVRFANLDPAIRGPIGEHMSSKNQIAGASMLPMDVTSIEYDAHADTLTMVFPNPVTDIGSPSSQVQFTTGEGTQEESSSFDHIDGTNVVLKLGSGSAGIAEGFATSTGLGTSIVSAIGAVPVNDFTNVPVCPQVVQARFNHSVPATVTLTYDRLTKYLGHGSLPQLKTAAGVGYELVAAEPAGNDTTILTFLITPATVAAAAGTLDMPTAWVTNNFQAVNQTANGITLVE